MAVNIGVASYITILMVVLMGIGFFGQARQDAQKNDIKNK